MSRTLSVTRAKRAYHSTPEWYTPPWLLERIAAFYGGSYFDPCPARNGEALGHNGLSLSWAGRQVFCNPPYGRDIVPWISKVTCEPLAECILLVPAYTETRWFAPLFAYSICFVSGRLYFMRDGKANTRAPHASVLVYRGPRVDAFADAFSDLGPILRTYRPRSTNQPELWEVSA